MDYFLTNDQAKLVSEKNQRVTTEDDILVLPSTSGELVGRSNSMTLSNKTFQNTVFGKSSISPTTQEGSVLTPTTAYTFVGALSAMNRTPVVEIENINHKVLISQPDVIYSCIDVASCPLGPLSRRSSLHPNAGANVNANVHANVGANVGVNVNANVGANVNANNPFSNISNESSIFMGCSLPATLMHLHGAKAETCNFGRECIIKYSPIGTLLWYAWFDSIAQVKIAQVKVSGCDVCVVCKFSAPLDIYNADGTKFKTIDTTNNSICVALFDARNGSCLWANPIDGAEECSNICVTNHASPNYIIGVMFNKEIKLVDIADDVITTNNTTNTTIIKSNGAVNSVIVVYNAYGELVDHSVISSDEQVVISNITWDSDLTVSGVFIGKLIYDGTAMACTDDYSPMGFIISNMDIVCIPNCTFVGGFIKDGDDIYISCGNDSSITLYKYKLLEYVAKHVFENAIQSYPSSTLAIGGTNCGNTDNGGNNHHHQQQKIIYHLHGYHGEDVSTSLSCFNASTFTLTQFAKISNILTKSITVVNKNIYFVGVCDKNLVRLESNLMNMSKITRATYDSSRGISSHLFGFEYDVERLGAVSEYTLGTPPNYTIKTIISTAADIEITPDDPISYDGAVYSVIEMADPGLSITIIFIDNTWLILENIGCTFQI